MQVSKSIWSVLICVLPLLFIIGLLRMTLNSSTFLPTYEQFLETFSKWPAVYQYIHDAQTFYDSATAELDNAIKMLGTGANFFDNMFTFFNYVGAMFKAMGGYLWLLGAIISYPFACIGWVFEFLFSGAFAPGASTPVDSGTNWVPQPTISMPFNPAWSA